MANGSNNARFLSKIDSKSKSMILENIAKHYGISTQEAFSEVTDSEAEHLLDYMTEPARSAASVLMQKHGLRGFSRPGAKARFALIPLSEMRRIKADYAKYLQYVKGNKDAADYGKPKSFNDFVDDWMRHKPLAGSSIGFDDPMHYSRPGAKARFKVEDRFYFGKGRKERFADDRLTKFLEVYNRNEDNNLHSENVVLLAKFLGNTDDVAQAQRIVNEHNRSSDGISEKLYKERNDLNRRLLSKFRSRYPQSSI